MNPQKSTSATGHERGDFKELADKLEPKLKIISNFKIGKTGQSIEERYNQEYSDKYDYYEVVSYSPNTETIGKFEEYLIDRFQNFTNCDNVQVGGGEMTVSDEYIVYIVYNK